LECCAERADGLRFETRGYRHDDAPNPCTDALRTRPPRPLAARAPIHHRWRRGGLVPRSLAPRDPPCPAARVLHTRQDSHAARRGPISSALSAAARPSARARSSAAPSEW